MIDFVDRERRLCVRCQALAIEPWHCEHCPAEERTQQYCIPCYMKHLSAVHTDVILRWETQARERYKATHGVYPMHWDHDTLLTGFLSGSIE
jgi:hypothetical protein